MSKRALISSLIVGLTLGLLVLGYLVMGGGKLTSLPKDQTGVNSIRQLMLTSHKNWASLEGEAVTTWYLADGEKQETTSQFSIVNPDKSRFEMPSAGIVWISDGENIFEIDNTESTYMKYGQPDIEEALSGLPINLDDTQNEIYRYPLAMWALSPIVDYIYPTGLAQRTGDYKLLTEDSIIDRKVWVISYQLKNDAGDVTMSTKYWVDQELGFILKAEAYSTDVNTQGNLIEETIFLKIKLDPAIPDDVFSPSLDGYKEIEAGKAN